jgi:hypothetical protein
VLDTPNRGLTDHLLQTRDRLMVTHHIDHSPRNPIARRRSTAPASTGKSNAAAILAGNCPDTGRPPTAADRILAVPRRGHPSGRGPGRVLVTVSVAVIVAAILAVIVVAVWVLLRSASPQPPGQHRGSGRARRRDPRDFPLTPEEDEPPTDGPPPSQPWHIGSPRPEP